MTSRENALVRGEEMTSLAIENVRRVRVWWGAALALAVAAGCGGTAPSGASAPVAAKVQSAAAPQAPAVGRRGDRSHAALNGLTQCTGTDVHQTHLSKFSCGTCHPSGGGYGFTTPYVFPRGTTTAGGTIVVATASAPTTCTVACHYPMGAAAKSITWDTPGPLACTSCHDPTSFPPAHPSIAPTGGTTPACTDCHQTTTHATGTVTLVGHAPSWTDPTSPNFHAFSADADIAVCQQCHSQDLTGGVTGKSCGSCHDQNLPPGVTSWNVNCVMCHGGVDNQTGAPPAAVWGEAGDPNRGGGTLDSIRVGAHTVHVTGSAIAPAFDCSICHAKPTTALSPGHVKGPTATVAFNGLATLRSTASATPTWTRSSATCSNIYCHGNGFAGGTNAAPVWTGGSSQATCGTCHGLPPSSNHPTVSGTGTTVCNGCHPATVDANGNVIAPSAGGKHLDGIVEATSGHEPSWTDPTSSGFHAFSANLGVAACKSCHGANLDGVGGATSVACASCHKPGGSGHDFNSCTACHGGTDNQTGAPPVATWGHAGDPNRGGGTLDPIRVGAHTVHAAGGPLAQGFDCGVCHVKPTSIIDPAHIDQPTATLTFGGIATNYAATPSWSRTTASCAGTYCHGATIRQQEQTQLGSSPRGTNVTPVWTSGPSQATCGTCHGLPPDTGKHFLHTVQSQIGSNLPCSWCHAGYQDYPHPSDQSVPTPSLHVNGVKDVIISPDAADSPANAYTRINGWDSASCHNVVACHGLLY